MPKEWESHALVQITNVQGCSNYKGIKKLLRSIEKVTGGCSCVFVDQETAYNVMS